MRHQKGPARIVIIVIRQNQRGPRGGPGKALSNFVRTTLFLRSSKAFGGISDGVKLKLTKYARIRTGCKKSTPMRHLSLSSDVTEPTRIGPREIVIGYVVQENY